MSLSMQQYCRLMAVGCWLSRPVQCVAPGVVNAVPRLKCFHITKGLRFIKSSCFSPCWNRIHSRCWTAWQQTHCAAPEISVSVRSALWHFRRERTGNFGRKFLTKSVCTLLSDPDVFLDVARMPSHNLELVLPNNHDWVCDQYRLVPYCSVL